MNRQCAIPAISIYFISIFTCSIAQAGPERGEPYPKPWSNYSLLDEEWRLRDITAICNYIKKVNVDCYYSNPWQDKREIFFKHFAKSKLHKQEKHWTDKLSKSPELKHSGFPPHFVRVLIRASTDLGAPSEDYEQPISKFIYTEEPMVAIRIFSLSEQRVTASQKKEILNLLSDRLHLVAFQNRDDYPSWLAANRQSYAEEKTKKLLSLQHKKQEQSQAAAKKRAQERTYQASPEFKRRQAKSAILNYRKKLEVAQDIIDQEKRIGEVSGVVNQKRLYQAGLRIVSLEQLIDEQWKKYKANGGEAQSTEHLR